MFDSRTESLRTHRRAQPRRWPWIVATAVMSFIALVSCGALAAGPPPPQPVTVTQPAPPPSTVTLSPITVTVPVPVPAAPPLSAPSYEYAPAPSYTPNDYTPPPAPRAPRVPRDSSLAERRRNTHSGHPCRAGERDADSDGYCGEGR